MECFIEVKEKRFLKDAKIAYEVVFEGCQSFVSKGMFLKHWVLTSASGVEFSMFDSFCKLVKLLRKQDVEFEFFAMEARNKKEGCHLHVLVSDNLVGKVHLQNLWVRVHHSSIVIVKDLFETDVKPLDEHVRDICEYVTFGNHKRSMVRYGYSSGWIGGIYRG